MRGEQKLEKNMEDAILKLVNDDFDWDVYLEEFTRVGFFIYNESVLSEILHKCKFKNIGSVYDYPDDIPQPEFIDGFDLSTNIEMFQQLAVSKKYNSIVFYSVDGYGIRCHFLIDSEKLKKFSKATKEILQHDSKANIFRGVNFACKLKEYVEISDSAENTKVADTTKKKIPKENLVFDEESTIVEVMNDIRTFFKKETKVTYDRIEIPYKRGIILHGTPGNGKSTAIREIIRTVEGVSKVVVKVGHRAITRTLASLMQALDGQPAIIIIEDIDSMITDHNRSEFLNILDGVEVKSGIFFIGTTNYPDKIDPAFMNRSGRFDRTYEIGNPSEKMRRNFFKSRKVGDLLAEYKVFKDGNKPDSDKGVIDLFVNYSDNLPMASLKEILTSASYILAGNPDVSVEESLERTHAVITNNRTEHEEAHNKFKNSRKGLTASRFSDDDDE